MKGRLAEVPYVVFCHRLKEEVIIRGGKYLRLKEQVCDGCTYNNFGREKTRR